MNVFLSKNDHCWLILQLDPPDVSTLDEFDIDIRQFAKEFPIPSLLSKNKFFEEKIMNPFEPAALLNEFKFEFPFNPKLLIKLTNIVNNNESLDYITQMILYSYLGWIKAYYLSVSFINDANTLISALLSLCNTFAQNENVPKNVKMLTYHAIYYTFWIYMTSDEQIDLAAIMSNLRNFLWSNKDLPLQMPKYLIHQAFAKLSDKNAAEFIPILAESILNFPQIQEDLILSGVKSLGNSIASLEIHSFDFFLRFIKIVEPEVRILYSKGISGNIIKAFKENENKINKFIPRNKKKEIELPKNIDQKDFKKTKTNLPSELVLEFDMHLIPESFQKDDLIQYIPEDIKPQFMSLERAINDSNDFKQEFLTEIAPFIINELDSDLIYDIYASLIFILGNSTNLEFPLELFFNDKIFNPEIILFEQVPEHNLIYKMRTNAFTYLITSNPLYIETILTKSASYPILFSELVYRFAADLDKIFDNKYERAYKLSEGIYEPFYSYKLFDDEDVIQARKMVLMMINDINQAPFYSNQFFEKELFCFLFFELLFEPPLSSFVSINLFNFLRQIEKPCKALELIVHSLSEDIAQIIQILPPSDSIPILTQVIKAINDSIQLNKLITDQFDILVRSMCESVIQIPDEQASEDLLLQVVQFLAITSHSHSMAFRETAAVESTIMRIIKGNPSQEFLLKLVEIIAGKSLPLQFIQISIKQPRLLQLFIKITINSEQAQFALDYLNKLCDFSYDNRIQCHEGELDAYIIEMLEHWKTHHVEPEILNLTLDLLLKIVQTASNVSIVQRFISLLCPVNENYLSPIQMNLLKTLNAAICASKRTPSASIPMDKDSIIQIKGLTSDHVKDGFAFSFWLYLEDTEPSFRQKLIVIKDPNDVGIFSATLKGSLICIKIDYKEIRDFGNFAIDPLEPRTWVFVTICIENSPPKNCSVIHVYSNNKKIDSLIGKYQLMQFKPGPLTCEINRSVKKSVAGPRPSFLGPIFLYKMRDKSDIDAFYDMGPRPNASLSNVDVVFMFEPVSCLGKLELKARHKDRSISHQCQLVSTKPNNTFTDILIDLCHVNTLLPLMNQIDMTLENGERFPLYSDFIVDIFKNILSLSESAQLSFIESNGFKVMAYLLIQADQSVLTFDLYKSFSEMSLVAMDQLIEEELQTILLNPFIWTKSKAQPRILKDWQRNLYQSMPDEFGKFLPLQTIITLLRVYYYYETPELEIIKPEERQDINIEQCRRPLINLAFALANTSLSYGEFLYILSHCLNAIDHKEKIELLQFLMDLVENKLLTPDMANELIQLRTMLVYMEPDISILVIRLIVSATKYVDSLTWTLPEQIDGIISNTNVQMINLELLISVINLTNDNPDLISLVGWMMHIVGNEGHTNFIELLGIDLKFKDSYSILWFIISAFTVSEELIVLYLQKIVRMTPPNMIPDLYFMADFVGCSISNPVHTDIIKSHILNLISNKEEHKDIIEHFIFFRSVNYPSYLFKSPMNLEEKKCYHYSQLYTYWKFADPFERFSLRIKSTKNGYNWIDSSLAQVITSDFVKKMIDKYQNYKLVTKSIDEFNQLSVYVQQISDFPKRTQFFVELEKRIMNSTKTVVLVSEQSIHKLHKRNMEAFKNKLSEFKDKSKKIWTYTWRSLTIERAPWNKAIPPEKQLKYISKRDNTYCSHYCPMKLCRQYNREEKSEIESAARVYEEIKYSPQTAAKEEPEINEVTTTNNKIMEKTCQIVKPHKETEAMFTLYQTHITIQEKNGKTHDILHKDIKLILERFCGRPMIEFYLEQKKSYLIKFDTDPVLIKVFSKLESMEKCKIQVYKSVEFANELKALANCWCDGKYSNFMYLVYLNLFCGRSFNSLDIYPVFPLIINELSTLTEETMYRDLSIPMYKIKDKKRCHPMNRNSVLKWLGRIEPFSSFAQTRWESFADFINSDDCTELIPEFYFMPEFLESINNFDECQLPSWAENEFDFVYKNRKALESTHVSLNLDKWITMMFSEVFIVPHPQRRIFTPKIFPEIDKRVSESKRDCDIVCSQFIKSKGDVSSLIVLDVNGFITSFSFNGPMNENLSNMEIIHSTRIEYEVGNAIFVGNDKICIYGNEKPTIVVNYISGMIDNSMVSRVDTVCIDSVDQWIAISGTDATISVHKYGTNISYTISSYREQIRCCKISTIIDALICGTRDGSLLFCSLLRGSIIKTVDLNGDRPQKILITKSFGFVLVEVTKLVDGRLLHEIQLFSINGKLLKKRVIPYGIKCWACFTSYKKFDHVVFADERDDVYIFEAYEMNISEKPNTYITGVMAIEYEENQSLIIALSKNGTIHAIPQQYNEVPFP